MARLKELSDFYDKDKDPVAVLPIASAQVIEANTKADNPDDPAIVNRKAHLGPGMPIPQVAEKAVLRADSAMPKPSKKVTLPKKVKEDRLLSLWSADDGEFIGHAAPNSLEYQYKIFVDEYLIDFDHARAALASGLSCEMETAKKDGNLLRKRLASVITARTNTLAGRSGVYASDILKEINHLARSNVAVYEPFLTGRCSLTDLPYEAQVAIKEVKVKAIYDGKGELRVYVGEEITLKLHDKLAALNILGGHLGVTNTKSEDDPTSSNKQPVIVLYGDSNNVQVLNAAGVSGMAEKKEEPVTEPEEFIEAEVVDY